jgi:hypothetical protein
MKLKNLCAPILALVFLNASIAAAQTNASKASAVGTWKLDLQASEFGAEPAPKSVTLTILKDTPEEYSWRVEGVDDKGTSFSYSWTGPADGTPHPVKGPDGKEMATESLKRDGDALVRHGDGTDGSSFDARDTMSADGNTLTDVVTSKSKDGKTSKQTSVMHRAADASGGRK